jgi:diamine N-acetyltransferase
MTKAMVFVDSTDMKITLPPEQAEMLSSKETIREIIKKNPDTVMAFDIYDEGELIGFVLVHRFEEKKYFLWEFAIDQSHQNQHKGTKALTAFIEYMKTVFDAVKMTTTYIYGNEHAKHVYEKVGFVETDVVDEPDCHEVNMAYYLQ